VQSRIKQLKKMEEISIPAPVVGRGRIRLRPPPHCGVEVVRIEGAGCTYDGQRWVLRGIDLSVARGEKIALVGYNGLGKTTLLRMLAGSLPLSEGRRVAGHKVTIGYQSQDFAETMDPDATVFSTVRATAGDATELEIRTLLGGFGFSGDAIEKTVNVLSGGEKIRLAFARLLMNPPNFLVLDEPTTHLDIQACEILEKALQDYKGTLCVVSHDVDFVRHVATGIIAMTPPGITRYAGGYDYYRQKLQESESAAATQADRDAGTKKGGAAAHAEEPRPGDRKALRRQRALERQQWHERTKEIEKMVRRAERQIEIFEKEQAELLKQLSGEAGSVDFASVSRRLKAIQDEIVRYTQRWERAASELETLHAERQAGAGGADTESAGD
jgi:ATP-binding cassette subfamily F protein 3